MSREIRRLVSGLACLCLVQGALMVMLHYVSPFGSDPSRTIRTIPLAVGMLLAVGIGAYFAAGLIGAVFFAGRRAANKAAPAASQFLIGTSSDDAERPPAGKAAAAILPGFMKGLVPALASFVWVMVGMGAFSLVTTPLVVGLTKLFLGRP